MSKPISFRRKLLSTGLAFVLAVSGMGPVAMPVIAADISAENTAAPAQTLGQTAGQTENDPQTRGLFLIALVPVFAQMVGTVGGNLIEILFDKGRAGSARPIAAAPASPSGSSPAAAPPAPAPAGPIKPMVAPEKLAVDGKYFAGVAYATLLVPPGGGEPQRVDPGTYQFRTGDKFMVRYVANMPGRVDIANINPSGREIRLGSWAVAAGQQVTLPERGSFEFTGTTGDEGLRIMFTPCTSGVATRDIAINAPATVNYGAILPVCGDRTAQTRDIAVNFENGMGYAVSQLEKHELQQVTTDARVFIIRLQHAAATTQRDTREWIVTPEEADQPVTRQLVPANSDPEGPKIEVRVPGEIKEVKPPVTIDVAFEPREGRKIDLKSLKITYLKLINIDITARMKPYFTSTGIFSDNAKLPPGDHSIEISLQDDSGRRTVERFDFKVLKP